MTAEEIITAKTEQFENVFDRLYGELAKIRTGRANTALIDNLMVDYYGTLTPLKQAANITVPEARQILVQPWDKSLLEAIESVILSSDVGVTPANDGTLLRITLPPMTEENRKDLVKVLGQKVEEARIAVRSIREDISKEIQKEEKDGAISEDEKFAGKDLLQKTVDAHNARIEEIRKKKEEEILTV